MIYNTIVRYDQFNAYQPFLFPEMVDYQCPARNPKTAGKNVIKKLFKIKKNLVDGQEIFLKQINYCIADIRSVSKLTITQREELILYSIETQGASTLAEIAEDCRIDREFTFEILKDLHSRNIIYQVKKFIPGNDRSRFMYKSTRKNLPEVC